MMRTLVATALVLVALVPVRAQRSNVGTMLPVAPDGIMVPPTPEVAGPATLIDADGATLGACRAVLEAETDERRQASVDLHVARVENAQLRVALAQLQAELDGLRLSSDRASLEARFRRELAPDAETVFDWQQRKFVPKPAAPK